MDGSTEGSGGTPFAVVHLDSLAGWALTLAGADHELRGDRRAARAAGRIGDVDRESGQGPRLSLQFAADGADAAR